jgi:uncharacterized protein (DUF433 family)
MRPTKTDHRDRISQDPKVMAGQPVVAGTRIPVERVLAHLADNPELDDLFQAFPDLTLDDVKACCSYAKTARRARATAARVERALSLAGAWSDLDFDEMLDALDRIRHESKPTPPRDLSDFEMRTNLEQGSTTLKLPVDAQQPVLNPNGSTPAGS